MKKTLMALVLILCMLPVCAFAADVSITFVANNGTDDSYVLQAAAGEEFQTLAADYFEAPAGKRFYCWLVQTPSMIDQLEPGVLVDGFDSDTTVTADWVDEDVAMLSITIDPNGGTLAEGISKTVTSAKGKDAILPPYSVVVPPEGEGKTFYAWDVDGEIYPGGGVYKNLQKNLTLKADWIDEDAMIAEVAFNANGGTGSMNAAGIELGQTYTLPQCGFTAPEGMRFKCWSIEGSTYGPGAQIVVDNSLQIQAVWEALPMYTVTYMDGAGKSYAFDVQAGGGFTVMTAEECGFAPEAGHTFAYWLFDDGYRQEQITPGMRFTRVGTDLTFTAVWELSAQTETRVEQKDLTALTAQEEQEMLADMPEQLDTVEEVVAQLTIAAVQDGFEEETVEVRDVTLSYSVDGGNTWIPATEENFPSEGITVALDLPAGTNATDYEFVVTHMFTVDSERLGTRAGEVETPEVTIQNGKIVVTLKGLSPVSIAWKAKPVSVDLPKTGDASCLMGWIALLGVSGAGLAGMKRRKK